MVEKIIDLYLNKKLSAYKISSILNISKDKVYYYLKKNNISRRSNSINSKKFFSDEYFFENIDSLSAALAGHFNDKTAVQYKNELLAAYKKPNNRHWLLKKKLAFEDYKALRDFPLIKFFFIVRKFVLIFQYFSFDNFGKYKPYKRNDRKK